MNVWTQANSSVWARDEKLALYNLFVAIIGVLVAIIGILVTILVPSLQQKQQQVDELIRQTNLLIEDRDTTVRQLQTDVKELQAKVDRVTADKNAAEQRAIAAEERAVIWQIAKIENHTQCDINYQVLNTDGSWTSETVKPNQNWIYWRKNQDVKVKYSYCLYGRLQEKEYILKTSKVVGHEPTDSERSGVPVSYFEWNNRSELVMYQN